VQLRALSDAISERDKLLPRLAQVVLRMTGPKLDEVTMTLDGVTVAKARLDQKSPVDPGPHKLVLKRGSATVQRVVTFAEGEVQELTLAAPALPDDPATKPSSGSDPLVPLGWAATIVGGVGVMAFGVGGAASLALESQLATSCPQRRCPNSQFGTLDVYDATRVVTTVGLVAGVVGLGAGLPLLLTRPKSASASTRDVGSWAPWAAPIVLPATEPRGSVLLGVVGGARF
jgi:hypothetical protein